MGTLPKGPAQQHLSLLDGVFGPETYFQHARMVITVARDLTGVMKVAHKLQGKINESFGGVVEVFMEHVKQELWLKLHETTTTMGLQKGMEVPDCQVTHIPDGIRVHPYKRDHLPTLEALLLWEDASGTTRGYCLYSMSHPDIPQLSQVDEVFDIIQPYFAKRWLHVELRMAPPVKGMFEGEPIDGSAAEAAAPAEDRSEESVGAGVEVTILACHPFGFARDEQASNVAGVKQCQPLLFKGSSDHSGRARLCFLPAEVNKVQVAETERFYGYEAMLPCSQMAPLHDGPTLLTLELTPKAAADIAVHVFELPRKLPESVEGGLIDWASEARAALPDAVVEVTPLKDGAVGIRLPRVSDDAFLASAGGLPEGCVSISVTCPGFTQEERTVMLLVGSNDFYIPLEKAP